MRLLLDENVDRGAVSVLRSEGFDALQSSEACGRGATDEQVLAAAIAFERVVVTHDRAFGLLAARRRDLGLPACSVLLLRPGTATIDEILQAIRETRLLSEGQPVGWFAVAALREGRAAIRFRSARD